MMKGVVHNIPISNGRRSSSFFLSFPGSFSIQIIFSNWNYNCSNVLDLRNPGTSKNAFCFKKLICLFTVLFFLSLHCVKRYQFENSLDILCCDKKKRTILYLLGKKTQSNIFKQSNAYCSKVILIKSYLKAQLSFYHGVKS